MTTLNVVVFAVAELFSPCRLLYLLFHRRTHHC